MNKFKNGIVVVLSTLISITLYAQQPPSKSKEKLNVVKSAEGELVAEGSVETDAGASKKMMKKKSGEPKSMKSKETEMILEMEKVEVPSKGSVSDDEVTSNEVTIESASDLKINNIASDNKMASDNNALKEGYKASASKGQNVQKKKLTKNNAVVLKSTKKIKMKKGVVKKAKSSSVNPKKKGIS